MAEATLPGAAMRRLAAPSPEPRKDTPALHAHYHTIVVGAGPAGIMAALHASPRGRVLLVDGASIPRDKSCGGMLNEYAQAFLQAVAPAPDGIVLVPRHVNFRYVDWDRHISKPTGLRFLNVDRRSFDHWLLSLLPDAVDVAGTTRLASFEQTPEGVLARFGSNGTTSDVECEVLIGADGARSTVRRALGVGSVATYVTLQDWVRLDGDLQPFFDCIYMRGIGDCYAYSYVVPKGRSAIVGSVYYPGARRPHEKQDQTMELLRRRFPQLGETERREACVALSVRSAEDVFCGSGRVLLAGEAGGFMSPTSGEGISYAMNTGRLAGEAVARAHDARLSLAGYETTVAEVTRNISRKLKWLPFMESRAGKYLAGFIPSGLLSRVTEGL